MDRPFRELHELYKILYQRAEAQQKAEEERAKEAEEAERIRKENSSRDIPMKSLPSDASTIPTPSPLEAEALENALEELL